MRNNDEPVPPSSVGCRQVLTRPSLTDGPGTGSGTGAVVASPEQGCTEMGIRIPGSEIRIKFQKPLLSNVLYCFMRNIIKKFIIVFFVGVILLFSGCISPAPPEQAVPVSSLPPASDIASPSGHPGVNYPQSLTVITNEYPPDPSHWIELHHIQDFRIGPGSDSPGLLFTIAGDTNLPAQSLIFIQTYRKDFSSGTEEPSLIWNVVVPVQNSSGPVNRFSYTVNVSKNYNGFPIKPGEYRAVVHRQGVNNSTVFEVMGKDPLPWQWVRLDPIGKHYFGESFNITGTTSLPAGSNILVSGGTDIHPCPFIPPGERSSHPGSICGDCSTVHFSDNIPVVPAAGNNTWNFTVNTTGWCLNESYSIRISKDEWDNVSSARVQLAGSSSDPLRIQTV